MKLERLFHVLVVLGGASVGGGCETDSDPERRDPNPDAAAPAGDAASGDATPGEALTPCLCNDSVCCDRTSEPAILAEGFECCWSTTCP